jgi:hypothetical protein
MVLPRWIRAPHTPHDSGRPAPFDHYFAEARRAQDAEAVRHALSPSVPLPAPPPRPPASSPSSLPSQPSPPTPRAPSAQTGPAPDNLGPCET